MRSLLINIVYVVHVCFIFKKIKFGTFQYLIFEDYYIKSYVLSFLSIMLYLGIQIGLKTCGVHCSFTRDLEQD